jgi:hypothetical protein
LIPSSLLLAQPQAKKMHKLKMRKITKKRNKQTEILIPRPKEQVAGITTSKMVPFIDENDLV